jgi:hypothetical protein
MNRTIFFSFLTFLTLLTINANGQFYTDSVFIYKNFMECGTTAKLWNNHHYLDSTNNKKVKLNQNQLTELIDIFKDTKPKKYIQQKHGIYLCYAIGFIKGQKNIFVVESTLEYGRLINLTTMKRWTIKDQEKTKRLQELIKKNWP